MECAQALGRAATMDGPHRQQSRVRSTRNGTWLVLVPSDPAELHLPVHEPGVLQRLEHQPVQELMYRPLYWFGNGSTPNLNPSLSLAENPVYSDGNTTVTIDLKPLQVVER